MLCQIWTASTHQPTPGLLCRLVGSVKFRRRLLAKYGTVVVISDDHDADTDADRQEYVDRQFQAAIQLAEAMALA